MASCHEMKLDEVYVCPDCGLELKVVKECTECSDDHGNECGCSEGDGQCGITCCGKELVKM